ncbi:MAG TPA: DUF192 domain-containing protein [Anaerolineae bacterium]|nr:DUF192 domain-containing protein [Anaerolineae bacterium]
MSVAGTWWLLHNRTYPLSRALWVRPCVSFVCRLLGLMGRAPLPEDRGLLFIFPQASRWGSAIHMFGMRFDLAVVWLDETRRVVDVRLARRWRSVCVPRRPARYVLELPVSWLEAFTPGDEVTWDEATKS